MIRSSDVEIGKELRPMRQLRTYYLISLAIGVLIFALVTLLMVIFAPLEGIAIMLVVDALILIPWGVWTPLYYRSIVYRFTDTEMEWRRGVWIRATGIVPYTKVTNVDIVQGPIMRRLGIDTMRIQTAGYSGQSGQSAEIKIEGIEGSERYRAFILSRIRAMDRMREGHEGIGEVAPPKGTQERILDELVHIREMLERQTR